MTSKVLDMLIQDLLDGRIEPEGLHQLEAELASNPGALARYLAFADLHCLLHLQTAEERESADPRFFEAAATPAKWRKFTVSAALGLAAVLLITAVVLQLLFVNNDAALRFSSHCAYMLTNKSGEPEPGGTRLKKDSRLDLRQGSVEITFRSGVRGVIVAPASVTLQDQGRLLLKQGAAWFHVPPNASGFEVVTSQMEVVDLGTEFEILSREGQADEVHVINGKVRARGTTGAQMTEVLSSGEARRIDANGNLLPIPFSSRNLAHVLPPKSPHLRWSFDEIKDGQLVASGTFPTTRGVRSTLIQSDSAPRLVPGKFGKALSLNGKGDCVVTDWPGFAGNHPRTVSFWIKLPITGNYRAGAGIVGWGNEDDYGANAKWKISAIQNPKGGSAVIRLSWGVVWLNGSTPLNDGQWHQIVAATTGETLASGLPEAQLYVDGRKELARYGGDIKLSASLPMDTDTITEKASPLVIGKSVTNRRRDLSFFEGEIDELEIFDAYLTEDEIPALSEP